MISKNLKIMFLYPNLHMSTLVPNGISILSAVLKEAGFKNVELFDTTFYQSPEETRAMKTDKSRYEAREKMGQVQPFNYEDRGIKLKATNMFNDFVDKVDAFKPHIIVGSVSEDTFPIFVKFMEQIKDKYKNLKMYDHIRSLSDTMSEIAKHKPDVIIDDYIQLIQADGVKEGRRFEIEKIMQEYKWICKSENCSAFLLSQLNREMDKRINPEPKMSDYSESGVIEQTAETAMFVFYGYNFDSESYDRYESKIISAKARYGNVGSYMVGFNGNKCKFYSTRELAFNDTKNKSNIKTRT